MFQCYMLTGEGVFQRNVLTGGAEFQRYMLTGGCAVGSPGVRGAAAGRGLERERGQLDVALLQLLLPAVLPLLLPRGLRPADRPQRRLHPVGAAP